MTNHQGQLDRVFHALSDPTRRAIVMRLSQGSASVSELSQPRKMALPTLLQHIRVLEISGLIATEKVGRVRICEVRPASLGATEAWLAKQRAVWERRLEGMEAYVTTLHATEKSDGKRQRKQ